MENAFVLNERNIIYFNNITHISNGTNGNRFYCIHFSDNSCKHFGRAESYTRLLSSLPDNFFRPEGITGIILNSQQLKGVQKKYEAALKRERFIARTITGHKFEWLAEIGADIGELKSHTSSEGGSDSNSTDNSNNSSNTVKSDENTGLHTNSADSSSTETGASDSGSREAGKSTESANSSTDWKSSAVGNSIDAELDRFFLDTLRAPDDQ